MLDLNLSVVNEENHNTIQMEENSAELDESGTSNSSILNADANSSNAGDEDSSSATATLNFDILKVGGALSNNINAIEERYPVDRTMTQSEFVTRQLFPVNNNHGGSSVSISLNSPNWTTNLSSGQIQSQKQPAAKKSRRGPRSRSSQYRGVTFYRRTGRWESHIWDCGKQVYLGGFDTAHAAARAYDRAAIKFRGIDADINFNLSDYEDCTNQMKNLSKEEFVHILRRQSNGFSRGSSKYRGVTLHKCGKWEARMGQFLGKKAYDKAAIKCNGKEAVTNFEPGTYEGEMISEAHDGGSSHSLDLNLGISTTPSSENSPKGYESWSPQLYSYDELEAGRLKMLNPATATVGNQPLKVLPVTSVHPPLWTGVYPNSFPGYEERVTEKRIEVGSSPGPQNWAWQMSGQVGPSPVRLFSAAASSGFPSPATTALSATTHPSKAPNHYFTSSIPNTPQYFYQMKPQSPPP